MKKRGVKPKGRVKIKWSSNFAYAIGLIATDGNMRNAGRHVTFVSKDMEQIKNFCSALVIETKIGKTFSGYKDAWAYRVQFGDVLFCDFLKSIGIYPAKSLTMAELKIPEKYFFDFLRGCFDGDGCSYSYWDKRWKSSFMFYISFASGSTKFITWLRSAIEKAASLRGHLSKHGENELKNGCYQLRYSKYEAIKLSRLMYKNKKGLKLKRKYLKIETSLAIVREHKGKVFVR